MNGYGVFEIIGALAGIAALVLMIKGAFHLSRLPRRSPTAPLLPEHAGAFLLLGIGSFASLLSEPAATPWRMLTHLAPAILFSAVAVRSFLRSRRGPESGSAA